MGNSWTDGWTEWARDQYLDKYALRDERGRPAENWGETSRRVVYHVLGALGYAPESAECRRLVRLVEERKFIPGGRYLAMAGKPYHTINNCFLYRCEDSREGWADLVRKCILSLATGGGVGVVYSDVRPAGSPVRGTGWKATGPLSPAQMVNEVTRQLMAGSRRSAIWGGLHWDHDDAPAWIAAKDWGEAVRALKAEDPATPAPLDMTNISVILDDAFFEAYRDAGHPRHGRARDVYWAAVRHMLKHGEPGFSVDVGPNAGENLRNACTEITSADDSDVCNLGHLNMARIGSLDELAEATDLATLFLLAGTVYSDVPHEEVRATRAKNRRLGLGLMGLHEWLIVRGHGYEVVPDLRAWLGAYRDVSDEAAGRYAGRHDLSLPAGKRAIAPTGTTGILGQTTTGGEPILYRACRRTFIAEGGRRRYQFVLDPTVERLRRDLGVDPDDLETAYSLALVPERRVGFQAGLQEYVDHGISSTVNLPAPVEDEGSVRAYGETFLEYLPRLRGLTVYPNGARAGQPFEEVSWAEAQGQVGVTFDEDRSAQCAGGSCGV